MKKLPVLIIGSGHLAYRLKKLVRDDGYEIIHLPQSAFIETSGEESRFDTITQALKEIDLSSLAIAYLVDDQDERNLELIIALTSLNKKLRIIAAFSNENIAPHLKTAIPNLQILNPARIAAPIFAASLDTPLSHLHPYTPQKTTTIKPVHHFDFFIWGLVGLFLVLSATSVIYFHYADQFSWVNSLYFVVVTVATVGYGDINLLNASVASKLFDIFLILGSMFFIWMIFSLTIDRIIKKRVSLSLGRKKYSYRDHVILSGLGRLGYFIAENLLARGEKVIIIEKNEASPAIQYFRDIGASVYIGDARSIQVLQDVAVADAKAIFSVINGDYINLEIGLNARSLNPNLRLILRIFDESIAQKVKESLDINLTFSMSAIVDETFFAALTEI